jgi:glycosyltransferase involved in cell wall biosynthesis
MRVALFTETFLPKLDGITNTLRHILPGLREQGHAVCAIAPRPAISDYAGARVLAVPSFAFPAYPEVRLGLLVPSAWRALDAFQPDLVHLVGPTFLGLAGLVYARRRRLPVLASYHTNLAQYTAHYRLGLLRRPVERLIRLAHAGCALTLCPSLAARRELGRLGVPRLALWRRGVDTRLFDPARRSAETRHRLSDAHPEAPLLLYVGRIAPEKRLHLLGAALRACPSARLAVVGDGPTRPELERTLRGLPVQFTGYLYGEALAAAYASADLFVFPSDTETFGNVALEAMASGLPVVAAAAGGLPEIVVPGETGLLFPPGDAAELGRTVHWLLREVGLRHRMAAAARRHALGYSWAAKTTELIGYYQALLPGADPGYLDPFRPPPGGPDTPGAAGGGRPRGRSAVDREGPNPI